MWQPSELATEKALLKLAAPVSKENQPVQLAHIKCIIALEQLRKETVAQLGPIDYVKDDGWMGTGVLPDEMIKDLKASEYKGLAGIIAKNPQTGQMDLTVAIMKKVNGTWQFPFGIDPYIDVEEKNGELLKEPKGDERDAMLQELNSQTKAAPVVIKRLQKKEFKKRSEVLSALTAASSAKGDGPHRQMNPPQRPVANRGAAHLEIGPSQTSNCFTGRTRPFLAPNCNVTCCRSVNVEVCPYLPLSTSGCK